MLRKWLVQIYKIKERKLRKRPLRVGDLIGTQFMLLKPLVCIPAKNAKVKGPLVSNYKSEALMNL
jgi:hypothetical protein